MSRQVLLVAVAAAALTLPAVAWGGPWNREDVRAARQAAFNEADANHDGSLSREEFTSFVELMKRGRAERRFQRADADGNGAVTLAELEAMPRPRGKGGCR